MSTQSIIEDVVGIFSGIVGFGLSKLSFGVKLLVIMEYLPEIHSVVSSLITAALCAVIGFSTTRFCHFIYTRLLKKFQK